MNGKYLPPMLDAGSSRVFNCNDVARKLERNKAEAPHIFKTPSLHKMVLIKEVIGADDPSHPQGYAVGTKLYLPYDPANIYNGGQSTFLHTPHLMQILHEQFGVKSDGQANENLDHDLKLLRALDKLPSLDGFLMRDALELEGFQAHENYFDISDTQRNQIQEYIRTKMERLVRAAYADQGSIDKKVTALIDKVWEAKDIEALDPLVQAFRFPRDKALAIFAGWKGIIFYSFDYSEAREKRESFAVWLREKAISREAVPREVREMMDISRKTVIARLRTHWIDIETSLQRFDAVYSDFVTSMNPGGFVAFLVNAAEVYWRLGDSLSKISHAVNCWEVGIQNFSDKRLPMDRLDRLLGLTQAILVPSMARSAAQAA